MHVLLVHLVLTPLQKHHKALYDSVKARTASGKVRAFLLAQATNKHHIDKHHCKKVDTRQGRGWNGMRLAAVFQSAILSSAGMVRPMGLHHILAQIWGDCAAKIRAMCLLDRLRIWLYGRISSPYPSWVGRPDSSPRTPPPSPSLVQHDVSPAWRPCISANCTVPTTLCRCCRIGLCCPSRPRRRSASAAPLNTVSYPLFRAWYANTDQCRLAPAGTGLIWPIVAAGTYQRD